MRGMRVRGPPPKSKLKVLLTNTTSCVFHFLYGVRQFPAKRQWLVDCKRVLIRKTIKQNKQNTRILAILVQLKNSL